MRMKKYPDLEWSPSEKTIYNAIYAALIGVGREHLPYKPKDRKRRRRGVRMAYNNSRGLPITQRPKEADERSEPGHWEIDTVVGGTGTSPACLVTLTERMMRRVIIRKIPDRIQRSVVRALNGLERRSDNIFATTRDLIGAIRHRPTLRRLCGWETLGEVPSEATFSRAFDAFARDGRPQRIHEALLEAHYGDKLAGHVNRDSTAIHAREKAEAKPRAPRERKRGRRGRRRKDEPQTPPPDPTRLQRQLKRDLSANLADLPRACDWGCKRNSQGKTECWRGYKAHLDVIDGDIPVSFILTSASVHDSQAAIPLAQTTALRVVNLYDLADAAYDAKEIREMSARLGHVAIIDHNPRRGGKIEFAPAEAQRYKERSAVERVNSHLHDEHGGRHVRVRGPVKVAAHLAFGLMVIAAEQMLRLLG